MNIGEISTVSQHKVNTFKTEAAQYRLAREGGWRQSWPRRFFIPALLFALAALGLAGK